MTRKHICLILAAAVLTVASLAPAQQNGTRTIEVSASSKPAAPVAGENTLEVTFTEATQPVKGLKLIASVGMTNMDMGTAHPPVKETAPGHYRLTPMFLMNGPWRVTLVSKDPKFTIAFDLPAGGTKPWQPVKQTIKLAGSAPASAPTPKEIPKQQPEPVKAEPVKLEPAKQEPVKQEPVHVEPVYGQDMAAMGHVASSRPQLREKATYAWTGNEEWDTRTGFGKLEPMVRMMILMMVGGSGMEGMKMTPMDMVFNEANFTETGDQPMKEMSMSSSKELKVEATLEKPGVGDNDVSVTILTPDGRPVEGAKIIAAVAMTSMDMGTTHPVVKDIGKGKYGLKANFSMMGPWRLTLAVSGTGMPPSTYNFDFEAK